MTDPPTRIRFLTDEAELALEWPDESDHRIPFRVLRQMCPCAGCVSEVTGERVLDPDSVPEEIRPTAVSYSGNYALKIVWSDSHDTGLFTWEYLRELGELLAAREAGDGD